MPNWCDNTATIKCNDINLINSFFNKLAEWSKTDVPLSGSSEGWVGRILHNSGADIYKINLHQSGFQPAFARAFIEDSWIDEDTVTILFQSAWNPAYSWLLRTCDKFFGEDNYEITYRSEEPGNGIFVTNDSLYDGCYIWDYWGENPDYQLDDNYMLDESTIAEMCEKILGKERFNSMGLDEAIAAAEEEVEDLSIKQWEYESIEDF